MQHNQASKSTLTDKQKFELCQYARDNRQTLKEYVNWVKVNWNVTIHESTISRILKSSDKRLNEDVTSPDTKRHKPVKFPELELALREFVLTYQHRTILNDAIIIEKAKLFANSLKIPENELQFSSGWLHKFKERNGIRLRKLHGEASSVNQDVVIESRLSLQEKMSSYPAERIYNMDETGLFYRLEPDTSLATLRLSGRKKDKERLSIALCTNADGSHKLKPLVIGKYAKPRCFKNVNLSNLGITYRNNKRAWMLATLFQEWLHDFDLKVSRKYGNQPVLLLLDNCPSHITEGLTLSNTEVLFLPPNTTSTLQPMDAGIIMSFKRHYRRYHIRWMLEQIEGGKDASDLKMDVLQAVRYIVRAWDEVTPEVISNCWKSTKILPNNVVSDNDYGDEDESNNNLLAELSDSIKKFNFPTVISVNEYLSFPEENVTFELPESDNIVSLFSREEVDDDDSNEAPIISASMALKSLETVRTFLTQQEDSSSYLRLFNSLENFIREKKVNSMKQSNLTQFLANNN